MCLSVGKVTLRAGFPRAVLKHITRCDNLFYVTFFGNGSQTLYPEYRVGLSPPNWPDQSNSIPILGGKSAYVNLVVLLHRRREVLAVIL
jgi:hypothetical protein